MSVCYDINCHDCEASLWIGQGHGSFYSGDAKVMEDLGVFLFKHEGHKLSFNSDNEYEHYEYEDSESTETAVQ